ncbi:DUF2071 domain-containing protein [soil metagenome]
MKLPVIRGVIDRRILANYRVDAEVLARTLPAPFRPKLHRGHGIAGICLIRFKHLRPRFACEWMGINSENAAHRVAVEWEDENGETREGVYIRRRDTGQWFNYIAGGRIFPGEHSFADFTVRETDSHLDIAVLSRDGDIRIHVVGDVVDSLPAGSSFGSLEEASAFFEAGALGYSATRDAERFDGLELKCSKWRVEPLAITEIQSSYFDDPAIFPPGSVEFDCALLMRGVEHEWFGRKDLCCRYDSPSPQLTAV